MDDFEQVRPLLSLDHVVVESGVEHVELSVVGLRLLGIPVILSALVTHPPVLLLISSPTSVSGSLSSSSSFLLVFWLLFPTLTPDPSLPPLVLCSCNLLLVDGIRLRPI